MPYPDPRRSAECLDKRRLSQQLVDFTKLFDRFDSASSPAYPEIRFWYPMRRFLFKIARIFCEVWIERGGNPNHPSIYTIQGRRTQGFEGSPGWWPYDQYHDYMRRYLTFQGMVDLARKRLQLYCQQTNRSVRSLDDLAMTRYGSILSHCGLISIRRVHRDLNLLGVPALANHYDNYWPHDPSDFYILRDNGLTIFCNSSDLDHTRN